MQATTQVHKEQHDEISMLILDYRQMMAKRKGRCDEREGGRERTMLDGKKNDSMKVSE
jgi:hypothetical protein